MSFTFRNALFLTASAGAIVAAGLPAQAQTINGGGSTLATPVYQKIFGSDLTPPPTYDYYPSGSGAAQTAFLNNTISSFGAAGVTTGAVDFGASDATLSSSQIAGFSSTYGYPLIQVPSFGTPITLPFNLHGFTTNGAVTLTDATHSAPTNSQVCGVLSGKITDWHVIDPAIASGTTIKVVYRSDSSGTTFLLTQHLAAVCTSTNSNFFLTGNAWAPPATPAATKVFASLFGTVPSTFIAESGSGGVQAGVTGTSNSIGYLSPDYTKIATINLTSTTVPVVAAIATTEGTVTTAYTPTTTASSAALAGAVFPTGLTTPPTGTAAANPANWIPTAPNPTTGYPIVGYTTIEASSCYNTSSVGAGMIEFLDSLYDSTGATPYTTTSNEIGQRGFELIPGASKTAAPVAGSFAASLVSTFLSGTGTLKIDNSTCPAFGSGKGR